VLSSRVLVRYTSSDPRGEAAAPSTAHTKRPCVSKVVMPQLQTWGRNSSGAHLAPAAAATLCQCPDAAKHMTRRWCMCRHRVCIKTVISLVHILPAAAPPHSVPPQTGTKHTRGVCALDSAVTHVPLSSRQEGAPCLAGAGANRRTRSRAPSATMWSDPQPKQAHSLPRAPGAFSTCSASNG
jgi:hypothetical protein